MIDFDNLPEFEGFTVYDRYTGDEIDREEVAKEVGCHPVLADEMAITEDGYLYFTDSTGNWYPVPKEGKYIIQISGEYYRW